MTLTGQHRIGAERSQLGEPTIRATHAALGTNLDPAYADATRSEIDRAVELARDASDELRDTDRGTVATFLDACADAILDLGDELLVRAGEETALPPARLTGERGRTVGQLRLFADVVRDGSHLDARIDHAIPDREPLPKPDVRRVLAPIGPVAVFGAGNFPLAFSVAGGDTASALAARCPVVVKGHPFHPGTSELVGEAIAAALAGSGLPAGTFSLVHGASHDVGRALVEHASTRAVAFTGSLRGGRALFDIASQRPHPIPVFAEMGSTNPVVFLPKALAERGEAMAGGLAQSVLLGVGQFCTCPGLAFVPEGPLGDRFVADLRRALDGQTAGTMLHPAIRRGYLAARERVARATGASEPAAGNDTEVAGAVFEVAADAFATTDALHDEVFGPATIVVRWSPGDLDDVLRRLDGQLTASVHGTDDELAEHGATLSLLADRAGRVIVNGYPTGVEVCPSMNHGGPYPATTDVRGTSVGTAAIQRFLRPICYQDVPDALLPPELKEANPTGVTRLVDGERT